MFGLIGNLINYLKKKQERRVTIVLLGLDNAGKTSIFNALNGEANKETTPSFGFSSSTLHEGKYMIDLYDLGGGRNIRRIWRTYLPEVHGVIYVVDSADMARFGEAKDVLQQTLEDMHLSTKPVLVFANKQDVASASAPHQVASALELHKYTNNQYNIKPCTAKQGSDLQPDDSIRAGFKWLVGVVDNMYATLGARVKMEAEAARQEELKKKREREERARQMKEERLKREREQAAAAEEQRIQSSETSSITLPLQSVSTGLKADNFVDLEKAGPAEASQQMEPLMLAKGTTKGDLEGPKRSSLLTPLIPPGNRVIPVVSTP